MGAIASLIVGTGAAHAGTTVVSFDAIGGTYDTLTDYGSNAAATPDIAVSYSTVGLVNALYAWPAGYGDLAGAAFAGDDGYDADVTLTPQNGARVTLDSFELAGYRYADIAGQTIEVLDALSNVVWQDSGTVPGAGRTHGLYSPAISSSGPLQIVFGPSWDVGIDDISFTESAAPEPTTWALMLIGFGGLGASLRWRRRVQPGAA